MESIVLFLELLGVVAWTHFWVPVLVWSFFASIILLMLLMVGRRLHPAYHHGVRLAVLCALPAGILLSNYITITPGLSPESGLIPFVVTITEAVTVQSLPEVTVSGEAVEGSVFFPGWVLATSTAFWIGLVQSILLVVMVMLLGRHTLHHFRLVWFRRYRLQPVSPEMVDEAGRLMHAVGLKPGHIQIAVAHGVSVPFTFGWLRPVIVLPDKQFEQEKLKSLLAHEIMHVRNNDFLIEWMVQVLRAVCWFHPLVQVYVRDVHRYREMLCDAEVISGMIADPRTYASLLLEFAGTNRQPTLSVMISMATTVSTLKERITAMSTYPKSPDTLSKTRRLSTMSSLCLLAFVVVAMAMARTEAGAEGMQPHQHESAVSLISESDEILQFPQDPSTGVRTDSANTHFSFSLQHSGASGQVQADADSVRTAPDRNQPPASHQGPEVFFVVEQMPEPIGGMQAIYEELRYPEMARRAGVEGRVVVQFLVNKEGDVIDPFIIRSIGAGADEAAIEAIERVRFKPGVQRGQPVDVLMVLPIVFRLGTDTE